MGLIELLLGVVFAVSFGVGIGLGESRLTSIFSALNPIPTSVGILRVTPESIGRTKPECLQTLVRCLRQS